MSKQNNNDLSAKTAKLIQDNIDKANAILQSIDTTKCIKENHECEKIQRYLESL